MLALYRLDLFFTEEYIAAIKDQATREYLSARKNLLIKLQENDPVSALLRAAFFIAKIPGYTAGLSLGKTLGVLLAIPIIILSIFPGAIVYAMIKANDAADDANSFHRNKPSLLETIEQTTITFVTSAVALVFMTPIAPLALLVGLLTYAIKSLIQWHTKKKINALDQQAEGLPEAKRISKIMDAVSAHKKDASLFQSTHRVANSNHRNSAEVIAAENKPIRSSHVTSYRT